MRGGDIATASIDDEPVKVRRVQFMWVTSYRCLDRGRGQRR